MSIWWTLPAKRGHCLGQIITCVCTAGVFALLVITCSTLPIVFAMLTIFVSMRNKLFVTLSLRCVT